tara:strand:- start:89 stop:598 length:510 start_codon:yes stop_codon:yes gene_type:complete
MKIILTLFVLLFSSSVVASDDLSGKSIVCGMTSDYLCELNSEEDCPFKSNQEIIIAIEFKNNNQASWYDYDGIFFNQPKDNPEVPLFYKTDLQSIWFYSEKESINNISDSLFAIDRKSLIFYYVYDDDSETVIDIGEQCVIYDNYEDINESIIKMKDKIIAEITKDNKI